MHPLRTTDIRIGQLSTIPEKTIWPQSTISWLIAFGPVVTQHITMGANGRRRPPITAGSERGEDGGSGQYSHLFRDTHTSWSGRQSISPISLSFHHMSIASQTGELIKPREALHDETSFPETSLLISRKGPSSLFYCHLLQQSCSEGPCLLGSSLPSGYKPDITHTI